jgi:hypothetical protein
MTRQRSKKTRAQRTELTLGKSLIRSSCTQLLLTGPVLHKQVTANKNLFRDEAQESPRATGNG